MSLLRLAGRPMLASMFVAGGLGAVRSPADLAPAAERVVGPLRQRFPMLPERTEQVVRLNGGVQVVAGLMLATGRLPRLSALALAATLAPTTVAGHRFWEAEDPGERMQQRVHCLKNLSMMGGLLISADDTGGAPSLLWRGRHRARDLQREAARLRRSVRTPARPAATAAGIRAKLPC